MISLRSEYLTEDFVRPFRRALAEAARRVDDAPDLYLKLAQRKRLIPENIIEGYVLQKFGGFPTPDGLPERRREARLRMADSPRDPLESAGSRKNRLPLLR